MQIIAGNTKIENLNLLLPNGSEQNVWFKREDQNPSGSFKDRLTLYLWPELVAQKKDIVIMSSGNMAISVLYYQSNLPEAQKIKYKIHLFIKDNLPEVKKRKLMDLIKSSGAEVHVTNKAKSDAIKFARDNDAFLLRASEHPDYSQAYQGLGEEIVQFEESHLGDLETAEVIESEVIEAVEEEQEILESSDYAHYSLGQGPLQFDACFICASSGTAAEGLVSELIFRRRALPVFVVQTSYIHPIASEYDENFTKEPETEANAISDRIALRKSRVVDGLNKLSGGGYVANNFEIKKALEVMMQSFPTTESANFTGNTALGLAGLIKALDGGRKFRNPLVIISGN